MDVLTENIPIWDSEFQAILLTGFCFLGLWVAVSRLFQILFSVMWPFILVAAILIVMPQWRAILANDIIPKQVQVVKSVFLKIYPSYNETCC